MGTTPQHPVVNTYHSEGEAKDTIDRGRSCRQRSVGIEVALVVLVMSMLEPDRAGLLVLVGMLVSVTMVMLGLFLGGRATDLQDVIRAVEPEWPQAPTEK